MPNFYHLHHKGANSLKSQFGLLVVVRLIGNFRFPNILFKKYLPLHPVQPCHAFPICIFVCLQELKSFFLYKKTVLLTHFITDLSVLVLTYGTQAVLVS